LKSKNKKVRISRPTNYLHVAKGKKKKLIIKPLHSFYKTSPLLQTTKDRRVESVIIPLRDGLNVIRKK
jgi:hypothetical protein